jgi:transposase-like protein
MSALPKKLIRDFIKQQKFENTDGVLDLLKDMFKDVLQEALEVELEEKLGYDKYNVSEKQTPNSRNGYSKKTVKSELGSVEINVPRDRNGEFEPQIIPKHQRNITGIEDKVLSLYTAGLSTRDIHDQIKELYDVEISAEMVSKITDRVLPMLYEWQNRPLETTYSFVFLDAIHFKVREEKQVVNKAAYVAIGVNMDGEKDVLGIWIGANETSKFWLSVLNDLRTRGTKNVLIFCTDGLNGFQEAIAAIYPKAKIQRCIIHQIRSSMKYVSCGDQKAFAKDLKTIYTAINEEQALSNFIEVKNKWGNKYPTPIKSWEDHWDSLSTLFMFPTETRKIMYTTNVIESLNSQYRKVTKTKLIFPTDQSLQKMLYLATTKITSKWTMRYRGWDLVLNQVSILFDDVLNPEEV